MSASRQLIVQPTFFFSEIWVDTFQCFHHSVLIYERQERHSLPSVFLSIQINSKIIRIKIDDRRILKCKSIKPIDTAGKSPQVELKNYHKRQVAQLLHITIGGGGLGFESRVGQIEHSVATARHCCDIILGCVVQAQSCGDGLSDSSHASTQCRTYNQTCDFFKFMITVSPTGSDIRFLQVSGRNWPLAAGKTHMSCSRGFLGRVVGGKVLGTSAMSTKSEAKGA